MTLGTPQKRVDAWAKVSGIARFTADFSMPGMRYAKYVRSPIAHGKVKSIDISRAKSLAGVDAVFTWKDVPDFKFPTAGHPYSLNVEKLDVADKLLLTDHVRHHGDAVAIVVACDPLTAERAAELVEVEYDELPVILTAEQALAKDAYPIHPGGNLIKQHRVASGDFEQALRESDITIESSYHTPIHQHCHMETVVSYAYMESDQRITIVSSTQIPHIVRRVVATALGIPWSHVRVIKPYLGGGFGCKQDVLEEPMVAFLSQKLGGLPVMIELTREECFIGSRTRHSFDIKARMGISREGIINTYHFDVKSNTGGYASHGHSIASAAANKIPYLYPRIVFGYDALTYYSNLPNAGAMRGYGAPQAIFALESLIEEAAQKLGMDPVEFRLKNVAQLGDANPVNKKTIKSCGISECLTRGRDLFSWNQRFEACKNQSGPIRRGVGVACFSYGSNTYPAAVEISGARLVMNQDGTVNLQISATEIGQGSDTVFAQMAAEVIGIPLNHVRTISIQDTDVSPFDPGAYASRQSYVTAPAIREAATQIREKIIAHAATMLGQHAGALTIDNGNIVFAAHTDYVLCSVAEVSMNAYYDQDYGKPFFAESSHKTRTNPPSFGCTFVEIEVDIPLCKIQIKDIINLHDSGQILNPLLAEGQVEGGMAMAIGGALFEEMQIDQASGIVLNGNLLDYKFPTTLDIPDLRLDFVHTHEPQSAFGHKSLGEPPIISAGPAIRNALWMATGVKIDELPITPKRLFEHLAKAGLL